MSFSRWGDSCWYTFDSCTLINNEPTMDINEKGWPLSSLKNKEAVLNYHREERFNRNPRNYKGKGAPPTDRYTEEEVQELSGYIDIFLKGNTP